MPYYAVANGKQNGIYSSWSECKAQIHGFKGAKYKKFDSKLDAEEFISDNSNSKSYINDITDTDVDLFVYTDGSCINNGRKNAVGGYGIYFGEGDSRNVSQRLEVSTPTNNIAELTAIFETYKIIETDILNNKKIVIVTDSTYCITCLSCYGKRNYNKNWVDDIKNKELVKKTYELYKDITNVSFVHIKAHTEKTDIHSIGNFNADKLANDSLGINKSPSNEQDRIYLKIPYANKNECKSKGTRWDKHKNLWYILADNTHKEELLSLYAV